MRPALAFIVLLLLAVAVVAAFAWVRAGTDRYAALEEEAIGLARVVRGAAEEAALTLETAERHLAQRLSAIARRVDLALGIGRRRAADVLQEVATEERVGRVFLLDPDGRPVARARHPRPLARPSGALLRADDKATLEWAEAQEAVSTLDPGPGETAVEGVRTNIYGTRRRFGVAYGRRAGGTLLLRAKADELARIRNRFGLGPVLERVGDLPAVEGVHIVSAEGDVLLAAGPRPAVGRVARPGRLQGGEVWTRLGPEMLRVVLPARLATDHAVLVDLRAGRARADQAVARSRRTILMGASLAACVALGLLGVGLWRERRHRLERARARARLDEERRFAELGALAGLVTHEVGNPLNAMNLALRLLETTRDEEERRTLVDALRRDTRRVHESVEGFLQAVTRPEAKRERVGPALLESVRERVSGVAREKGVTVDLRVEAGHRDLCVSARPLVVEEALVNVVRNAVRATPPAGRVEVAWLPDERGVRVRVRDEGPGFPEGADALLRLGGAPRAEGHGLGLPLARRFIEAEGGRLVLGAAPGGGAEVGVVLPVAPPEEECGA